MASGTDGTTPVERLVDTASGWPGVTLGPHPYDGVEFRLEDYEFGHAHYGWESLHVNYPRRMRDSLIADRRTGEHPYFTNSGWTSYDVRSPEDVEDGLWLLRVSYLYRLLTRRENPAAQTARDAVDVVAELDELEVSGRVRELFEDVADGHGARALEP